MPVIDNTVAIPEVPDGFHLLEVEGIEEVHGTAYNDPETPEMRLKLALRVRTPNVSDETFHAWVSPRLGDKSTFGSIVKAALGATPRDPKFDTDVLIGRRFAHMVSHNERGWPKLVNGTAAPAFAFAGEPSF